MKPRKAQTLTCSGCGSTVTAQTKKQATEEARQLGWYHISTAPMCRACELEAVAKRAAVWQPGDDAPF